jgi:hypothetical protein
MTNDRSLETLRKETGPRSAVRAVDVRDRLRFGPTKRADDVQFKIDCPRNG